MPAGDGFREAYLVRARVLGAHSFDQNHGVSVGIVQLDPAATDRNFHFVYLLTSVRQDPLGACDVEPGGQFVTDVVQERLVVCPVKMQRVVLVGTTQDRIGFTDAFAVQ